MLSIQTDYSTLTAVLGRRAHSHREALSSAAFVADQVLRSCSSYGEDSLDALQYMHGEWWSPCIYRRNQNDSSPLELQLRREPSADIPSARALKKRVHVRSSRLLS